MNVDEDHLRPRSTPSARSILLTLLGEFVLPRSLDGREGVWTSTLIEALDVLGYSEQNTRAAMAALADREVLDRSRHGRRVRWRLTEAGSALLTDGARRIYGLLDDGRQWDGHWLVLILSVPEGQRAVRQQLRRRLGFLGFGALNAGVLISPRVSNEAATRAILADLDLGDDAVIFRAEAGVEPAADEPARIISRAWDLETLADDYRRFTAHHGTLQPSTDAACFTATVHLVHDWRRFPFDDPDVPVELLPSDWPGRRARSVFDTRHAAWGPAARRWFDTREAD